MIADDNLAKQYGLGAMPLSVLIDREGRIADSHSGVVDRNAWETEIQKVLDQGTKRVSSGRALDERTFSNKHSA